MAVASYELSQDKQRFCAHYTTRTRNICQKYPSYNKNYKTQSPLAAIIIYF